jgi:hypothetical protein
MTIHVEPTVIGQHRDSRGNDLDEPTYVGFEHSGYCCTGCVEGHDGTHESGGPVELTVAWNDDDAYQAGFAIEIRWETPGRRPQKLLLDTWAAEALAAALNAAHYAVGVPEGE